MHADMYGYMYVCTRFPQIV